MLLEAHALGNARIGQRPTCDPATLTVGLDSARTRRRHDERPAIDAEATRQPAHGQARSYDALWRIKANQEGRLAMSRGAWKDGARASESRTQAIEAWAGIARALASSSDEGDR